ncbi:hypothetical protein TNCV_4103091 [Trichonephila clavipes]|uniref:Uncharacterized protein n=1 Tax=Trichonephila clavata TaxID=2740835 RepID=A0A8X6HWQ5_TRICU|nr:hypothetical protein TNCT_197141 [Trichonephila clavata]GFT38071.1 hypothetical protein TNCV_4103091 [Trichonephila clavipes]
MSRERQQRRDPEQADNWRDADKSNKRKTPSLLFYFRAHLVMEFSRCHGNGSHALMRNRLWSSVQGLEKKRKRKRRIIPTFIEASMQYT